MATFDSTPVHALTSTPAKTQQNTGLNAEDDKKARRRDQCRINQTNYRRRKRLDESARLSSNLSNAQAAALVMAVSGIQQNIDKLQSLTSSLPALIAKWKKAKRKEQCRQAQAKFQKRKREKLQALIDSIASLNREIKQLKTRKAKIMKQPNPHVRLITYFYKALQADVKEQQLPDVRNYEQTYGCTPALQVLADLQREEFDSMESLKLHWLWYRLQFRQFELSITSYECLVAGEPVIVKASGSLRLGIECEDKRLGTKRHVNVCPVLQQFEFEIGEQIVRRITSEVSLVSGEEQASPMAAVNTLSFLSRGLCFH